MRTLLLGVVTALSIAAPASAQSDIISEQLAQGDAGVRQNHSAFSIVTTLRGDLNDGQQRGDIVNLSPGGVYYVLGVCDNDCSDLDMVITDSNGREVGSDHLADDTPVVTINDGRGGAYQIQSIMAECSVEPCATAVRIYRVD